MNSARVARGAPAAGVGTPGLTGSDVASQIKAALSGVSVETLYEARSTRSSSSSTASSATPSPTSRPCRSP
ncbi:hypothetical protein G6O69_24670 [Pseudenhygromyxa sp. WMMC2535]|uniref:hypothetical protein n=1 Tax=Pseudenhygromyxa sp. WMMC2535 TaxID=2712867 RepID=UPI001595FD9F|nr:hypothetical protein [Pseudenhygromyxa sp. WMMC2535]NVB41057.1 hypothetical protein [Pseudenhygromyxa sp. WMMC2535]